MNLPEAVAGQHPSGSTPLRSRTLGRTGLRATTLGFGGARLRGDGAGIEPIPTATAIATVHACIDAGVRYIDTAPLYGDSESLIGQALRSHPLGSEVIVATKVGFVPAGFDFSAEATLASIRRSAQRLGLSCIPIAQLHEVHEGNFDPIFQPGGALDGLRSAQADGLIGFIGVTGGSHEDWLVRAVQSGAFDTVLIWMATDLLNDRTIRRVLPVAAEHGTAVIVGAPYAAGVLAGDRDATGARVGADVYRERFRQPLEPRLADLEDLCAAHQVDLGAAALQFVLRDAAVATTVPGAYSAEQVTQNVRRMAAVIPEAFWRDLDVIRSRWPAETRD